MSTGKNPLAKAEAADKKRKIAIQVGVTAVLVALVAAIGIGIAMNRSSEPEVSAEITPPVETQLSPVGGAVTETGTVRVGNPDAPVQVRVVADMQCPACQQFETANGAALAEATANGTAVVEYQVISFLDRASSNQYSSRAANASFCVAQSGTDNYQDWLQSMFERQSGEGGAGLSNEELVQIANDAGYTDPAVTTCIVDRPYHDYVMAVTQETMAGGVESTPSVFVNGELNQTDALFTPNGLASVIADAAK
ncbi:disulfide bond formation protein DsbA [Nocardia mangyaensis]|uniref:Disulfide bond formation protein DsbA n=1 Tax=Nocardia mangyaensis TaxID=2213200 RepID=A0A1J0VZL7_9NOCA|nr:thioredoxin domain-containing protein [Nocardia mangyaensis]APE37446.1 disulfide bond formation protein DsbA [Nocardia mangyaensis]